MSSTNTYTGPVPVPAACRWNVEAAIRLVEAAHSRVALGKQLNTGRGVTVVDSARQAVAAIPDSDDFHPWNDDLGESWPDEIRVATSRVAFDLDAAALNLGELVTGWIKGEDVAHHQTRAAVALERCLRRLREIQRIQAEHKEVTP